MLTIITPTGGRPEAFALCERWMSRQTFRGDLQWLVVDDGEVATPVTMNQTVIRPQPLWEPGSPTTQHRNLAAALAIAKYDRIAIIEDDDWYGPEHLVNLFKVLESAEVAGEVPARYYNVAFQRFKVFADDSRASLCQTGFRSDVIPTVLEICANLSAWIDLELWKRSAPAGLYRSEQVVGIKGMPGRAGVSRAHKAGGAGWQSDVGLGRLRQWIGVDADLYQPFLTKAAA